MSRRHLKKLSAAEKELILGALHLAGIQGRVLVMLEWKRSHGPHRETLEQQGALARSILRLARKLQRSQCIHVS